MYSFFEYANAYHLVIKDDKTDVRKQLNRIRGKNHFSVRHIVCSDLKRIFQACLWCKALQM